MPLTDAFEIIRAEVSTCRIFAVFAALNPLKLQRRRSYFPPFSNLRAITLRLYKKPASGARDTPNAARLFVPSPAVSFFGDFRTPAPSARHLS
jgi:hypothetical protein